VEGVEGVEWLEVEVEVEVVIHHDHALER